MNASPDVLILPSKLTHLIKDFNGSLIVNPGSLAKGSSGGSYAELSIHPLKESDLRDAIIAGKASVGHEVVSRTRVSIVKI